MTKIALTAIRTDGGTQTRAALNQERIADYSEAMDNGAVFPPVTVFFDGTAYWLADGFHRVEATRRGKVPTIAAEVKPGTRRDAILYSVGANAQHGLHRSNEDKRRAVMLLLEDEEWSQWSDREIAKRCGVHHDLVAKLRPPTGGDRQLDTRMGADGKVRKMPIKIAPVIVPDEPLQTDTERQTVTALVTAITSVINDAVDDNDPGPEPNDDELDVYEADPEPVRPEPVERRGWGEDDLVQLVMQAAQAHRDFRSRVEGIVSKVDPRFATDLRDRCVDLHLASIEFLRGLLPPHASRAAETRATFQVVKGGK